MEFGWGESGVSNRAADRSEILGPSSTATGLVISRQCVQTQSGTEGFVMTPLPTSLDSNQKRRTTGVPS